MSELGTKAKFRGWLSLAKHITYTKYTTLKPEMKAEIWAEYKKVKGKHETVGTSRSGG
jgi:hypothetical protein